MTNRHKQMNSHNTQGSSMGIIFGRPSGQPPGQTMPKRTNILSPTVLFTRCPAYLNMTESEICKLPPAKFLVPSHRALTIVRRNRKRNNRWYRRPGDLFATPITEVRVASRRHTLDMTPSKYCHQSPVATCECGKLTVMWLHPPVF